jgi:glutamyl-tRNA synthetase
VNVELLTTDKKLHKGFGEPGLRELKEGDIIQFERVGFCRLDRKEKDKITFWFAHR